MRTVFDNHMTAHVWAQQNQDNGRSHNGNLFFEDHIIYSYGYHFPIAMFYNGTAVLNMTTYSVSTSAHQSLVFNAVGSKYMCVDRDTIANLRLGCVKSTIDSFEAYTIKEVEESIRKSVRAIYPCNKESWLRMAQERIKNCRKLCMLLDSQVPQTVQTLDYDLANNLVDTLDRFKSDIKQHKAKKKLEKAQKKIQEAEKFEERKRQVYTNSGWSSCSFTHNGYALLRASEFNITTSQKATVSIRQAKIGFKYMFKLYHNTRESLTRDSACCSIEMGSFKVNLITMKYIVAGCHKIKWKEIMRLALELNWVNEDGRLLI